MKKLLISKYEGVYVYEIVLAFIAIALIGTILIHFINHAIDKDLFNDNKEIVLNRNEFDIITDNLNNISSNSWNETYNGSSLRDIYRNNYIKYISNITSDLELGNITFEYNGSIGEKYYRIKYNENKWFIFNKLVDSTDTDFYIVDNNMDYHLVKTTITNEYNTNKNYKEYTYNGYDFFYDSANNTLYGYKYITKDNDYNYYLSININNLKLSDSKLNSFMNKFSKNITITNLDNITKTGFTLPNTLEKVSITDNFMFDFKTDVTVKEWYNNLSNNSINIYLVTNESKTIYNIEETISNIDSFKNEKGYLLYNYFGNNIYLKYNHKKYKKFNTTEGGITGIVFNIENRIYNITFAEKEYKSQKELNNILNDMKTFIIASN